MVYFLEMSFSSVVLIHRLFLCCLFTLTSATGIKTHQDAYLSFDVSTMVNLKSSTSNCIAPLRVKNMVLKNRCTNNYDSSCKNSTKKCYSCVCKFSQKSWYEKNIKPTLRHLEKVKVKVISQEDFELVVTKTSEGGCNSRSKAFNVAFADELYRSNQSAFNGNFDLVHPNQRDEKQNSKSFEILFYIAVVIIFGLTTLLLTKRLRNCWKRNYMKDATRNSNNDELVSDSALEQLRNIHLIAASRAIPSDSATFDSEIKNYSEQP